MRDLLKIVEGGAEPPAEDAAAELQTKELMALRLWYLDWADTARGVVTRRDYLIRLGLAKRKAQKKGAAAANPPVPATPVIAKPATPDIAPSEASATGALASNG